MSQTLNSYDLSRAWFDFCFAHPNMVKPNHTALYFFAIEHCNRLGWKLKFGLPSGMTMEAIGIRSYKTYTKTLADIIEWGFVVMIEKSTNQYSSNIISLTKFDKKLIKSLDKAMIGHDNKQKRSGKKYQSTHQSIDQSTTQSTVESTDQSIASIDKQVNNKQLNKEQVYREFAHLKLFLFEFDKLINEGWSQDQVDHILDDIQNYAKNTNYTSLLFTARKWLKKEHKPNSVQKKISALELVKQKNASNEQFSSTGTD